MREHRPSVGKRVELPRLAAGVHIGRQVSEVGDGMASYSRWLPPFPARVCYNLDMENSATLSAAPSVSAPTLEGQIQRKLEALFPSAEARRWLETPQPPLDGSPRDLMIRGEAERVLRVLTRLEQGIPT